VFNVYIDHFVR